MENGTFWFILGAIYADCSNLKLYGLLRCMHIDDVQRSNATAGPPNVAGPGKLLPSPLSTGLLLGHGTSWHKSGTSWVIRDGWQPTEAPKAQSIQARRAEAGVGFLGGGSQPLPPARGSGGSAVSSPSGFWGGAPAKIKFGAFLALKSDIWWQQF